MLLETVAMRWTGFDESRRVFTGANAFVIKKAGRWRRMDTALRYVQVVEEDVADAQRKAFGFTKEVAEGEGAEGRAGAPEGKES